MLALTIVDSFSLGLAGFGLFLTLIIFTLRGTRWHGEVAQLAAVQMPSCHMSATGIISASLPFITRSQEKDACPLLRSILTGPLHCGPITEISGDGELWWDFTYKHKRFTCRLQPKSIHGSELSRTNNPVSNEEDFHLFQQLIYRIAWYSASRTGLTCHSVLQFS